VKVETAEGARIVESQCHEEGANSDFNPYYYTQPCNYPPLCYDFTTTTNLLNNAAVQKALGVSTIQWQTCVSNVYEYLEDDWAQNLALAIPAILGANVRVLIYEGLLDWICNSYGVGNWTVALQWPGQSGFQKAPLVPWHVNGTTAGYVRTYSNFTYLSVEGAGHMVPHDQPVNSLSMLRSFLSNQPFSVVTASSTSVVPPRHQPYRPTHPKPKNQRNKMNSHRVNPRANKLRA